MRKLIITILPVVVLSILFSTKVTFKISFAEETLQNIKSNQSNGLDEELTQQLKDKYAEMVKVCESTDDNEACNEALKETLQGLKSLALERMEGSYKRTENMVERLKATRVLSEKEQILVDETLNNHTNLVNYYTNKIENAKTLEELNHIYQEKINNNDLRTEIRELNVRRTNVGYLNIEIFINRLNDFIIRVESETAAAKDWGHNTSDVEKNITLAKEKILLAQDIFNQNFSALEAEINQKKFTDVEDSITQLLKAKDLLIEAKNDLQKATEELNSLYRVSAWETQENAE